MILSGSAMTKSFVFFFFSFFLFVSSSLYLFFGGLFSAVNFHSGSKMSHGSVIQPYCVLSFVKLPRGELLSKVQLSHRSVSFCKRLSKAVGISHGKGSASYENGEFQVFPYAVAGQKEWLSLVDEPTLVEEFFSFAERSDDIGGEVDLLCEANARYVSIEQDYKDGCDSLDKQFAERWGEFETQAKAELKEIVKNVYLSEMSRLERKRDSTPGSESGSEICVEGDSKTVENENEHSDGYEDQMWESETDEIFAGARERFSSVKRQENEQYSTFRKDLDGHFNGELSRESHRRSQILNRLAHLGLEDGERSICFLLLARAFEADALAWNILRFISTWEDPRLESKYWTSSFVYHDLRVITRFGVIRKSGDTVTTIEQVELQVREEARTATASKTELKSSIMRNLEPRGTPTESGHAEESEDDEEGTWDEDIDGPFCQASVFLKQFRERQKTVGASHRPESKFDGPDHATSGVFSVSKRLPPSLPRTHTDATTPPHRRKESRSKNPQDARLEEAYRKLYMQSDL
eukprot:TRINITY_DN17926_c0_g1_i1.p1 TRINITY_DN17926_c0_g1~~TRINITY_DN17926_c0_g1_i1.p1  ORF type:complete len:522 (-),score=146.64 TRINITY_DN17926_c0_g1_i1:203-1768(-)